MTTRRRVAHLRAVLHDQGRRQGHRPRPLAPRSRHREQSGGSITVESKVGLGTVFRAYLPVTTEQTDAPRPAAGPPTRELAAGPRSSWWRMRPRLRKLISQVLKSAGHTVLEAAGGEGALRAASAVYTGSISTCSLTDVIMPGISGPELVAKLAQSPAANVVVVFIVRLRQRSHRRKKSLESTASFLPKPYSPRTLLTRIDTLLGFGTARRESDGPRGVTRRRREVRSTWSQQTSSRLAICGASLYSSF